MLSTGLTLFGASSFASLALARSKRPISSSLASIASNTDKLPSPISALNTDKVFSLDRIPSPSSGVEQIRKFWGERDGEHAWLEDVLGDKAMEYVKDQNKKCLAAIGEPEKSALYKRILEILDSKDKIPYVTKLGDYYYNFWQDAQNKRGILRRTSLLSYQSDSPLWELVLDVDALGTKEGESWVYKGYNAYIPDDPTEKPTRIMLNLSRGGADATVAREFDLTTLAFVEGGFTIPEAKSRVAWKSKDVLLVGTDFKDGKSLTDSGYPRTVREWTRGTPLGESALVFEGGAADVSITGAISKHRGFKAEVHARALTFYTSKKFIKLLPGSAAGQGYAPEACSGEFVEARVPEDASTSQMADQLLISLRSEWVRGGHTYPAGSLLATPLAGFLADSDKAAFVVLFSPTERVSLDDYTVTKNYIILQTLDNVKSRLVFWQYCSNNIWTCIGEEREAVIRGAWVSAVDRDETDSYWLNTNSFTSPSTLSMASCDRGAEGVEAAVVYKRLPAQFDATGLIERQGEATSFDGTKIPYFIISRGDIPLDGSTPTLLYGYGGFEISLLPSYTAVTGAAWLERGGAYVSANIRGGGEFGPKWHQAALKANRKLAYDDFIAVAEHLVAMGVTTPARLGIRGGSNGGLLMGNALVRRPDLFGAVCCAVPLLDMKRYHKLLAGASWMAEYGNPDTEDWTFMEQYSAYQNIDPRATGAPTYPAFLMTTSTRDDRVHPYHARCFVKRLLEVGAAHGIAADKQKVYYYENIEGGHGGAADNKQQAFMNVLYLEFLWNTIGSRK